MILDIVLLVILLLAALVGYKKGLVKIVLKLVGFILSLVLAYIFCTPLSNFLYHDVGLGDKISTTIEESISDYIEEKTEDVKGQVTEKAKDKVEKTAGNGEYMDQIENLLTKSEKEELETTEMTGTAVKNISEKITMYVLKALAFIIIIILVNICIFILTFVFDGVASLPVIKTFNKTGGTIISIILTLLKIWIVLGIISLAGPLDLTASVLKLIEDSTVVKWLYTNNILMDMVLKSITK